MPIATIATAVVRVIGIVLMTTNPTDNGTIRAIAPRIPSAPGGPIQGVEPHTAFLAFPAADYVSSRGWPPVGMEVVQGMLFVKLDGEQITINGQHAAPPPSPSATNLPAAAMQRQRSIGSPAPSAAEQPAPPRAVAGMQLPHLKTSCCSNEGELRREFQPPYAGAAAVVEVSPATVQAKTCSSLRGRIDTHLSIPNDGTITITARKRAVTKEIVIRGSSTEIYLGNLPTWFFDASMPQHDMGRPHYEVYFMMTDSKSCDWTKCTGGSRYGLSATPCDGFGHGPTLFREGITTGAVAGVNAPPSTLAILANARIDVECSNTQWP